MKRQVRRNVFETNSSSVHSISLSNGGTLEQSHLYVNDETNKIRVNFGEFGWGYERLNSQSEKLEYLLTMAMSTEGRKLSAPEEFIETEGLKLLNDEIANYCNCDGIEIIGKMEADSWSYNGKTEHYISYDGYIDHQSVEGYSSLKDFLDKNDTTVVDYVFNSKVSMIIDNDNH
jgi:hypothetical protein